jgi:hypothetical protein
MKMSGFAYTLICIWVSALCLQTLHAANPNTLVDQLRQTQAVNVETFIDEQFDDAKVARGFRVANPYGQKASEVVQRWDRGAMRNDEVCAIRFLDSNHSRYELHDFDSASAAVAAGFAITHQGRCGSCSTLQDLSIYLAVPDLTSPARQCARRTGLKRKKQCFQESIGFTSYCAESWAYNALHTRQKCLGACIADYGLFNLIFGHYPGPNSDETGQLRPCLQCDENKSGAGFKFSAGRTRRNSGIESAIERRESEIYPVDHSAYFP